jgi:uncharacterized protein
MSAWLSRPALAVFIGLLVIAFDHQLLGLVDARSALKGLPFGYATLTNAFDIVALALSIRLIGGVRWGEIWQTVGLTTPVRAALLMAVLIFAPIAALLAATTPRDPTAAPLDLAMTGFVFPIAEEIVFRGLAVGTLLAAAGWRLIPALIAPAILFGIVHLAQGDDAMEAAGVFAITLSGGLLFGWLYHRWGRNLWPAIMMHVGLNTIWSLFALGDNAIGGWLGNVLRLTAVATAIALSIWGLAWLRRTSGEATPPKTP